MPFDTMRKLGKGRRIVEEEVETPEIDISEIVSSVIKNRRSVRRYLKRDVEAELIEKILDSARYAPSCGNYQPWEFIVVKDLRTRELLVEASYNQKWMLEAPVLIIACTNSRLAGAVYGERGLKLYGIQAAAAAIQNILLTAESLKLGTCWIGAFSEIIVSRILECPDYVRPCAIITLGYPAVRVSMPRRQPMDEFVHIDKFGNTLLDERVKKEKKPTYMKFR